MIHFLSVDDHDADRLRWLLGVAAEVDQSPESWAGSLAGRSVAVLLDGTSTRARTSLLVGAAELGAASVLLPRDEMAGRGGEPLAVTAAVLSGYVDLMAPVGFGQSDLEEMGTSASIPVLNGGSSRTHPCQALADLLVLRRALLDLPGRRLAWIGGATPVLHSLLLATPMLGMDMAVHAPVKGRPPSSVLERARQLADSTGARVELHDDPREAVERADAVYLGTGVRLVDGGEPPATPPDPGAEERPAPGIVVDSRLLRRAADEVRLLHSGAATTLPDGGLSLIRRPGSLMLEQAAARLPVQKAVMLFLLDAV